MGLSINPEATCFASKRKMNHKYKRTSLKGKTFYLPLLLVFISIFSSCQKNKEEAPDSVPSIKFTVNGITYEASGMLLDTDNTNSDNGAVINKANLQTYT
ncbi:MAG TPA: hypothetical protein VHK69_02060, partial [Chitinophagaceae bacterium]|nr:hypothetical protein [Chitinophagaceae bacterium]